jgi:hypothetical protein
MLFGLPSDYLSSIASEAQSGMVVCSSAAPANMQVPEGPTNMELTSGLEVSIAFPTEYMPHIRPRPSCCFRTWTPAPHYHFGQRTGPVPPS